MQPNNKKAKQPIIWLRDLTLAEDGKMSKTTERAGLQESIGQMIKQLKTYENRQLDSTITADKKFNGDKVYSLCLFDPA